MGCEPVAHNSGHIVESDTSQQCDMAWEKHTRVAERPLRSV